MGFGWGESQDNYNQVYNDDQNNQASLGHEVLAGGAAFAGFKAFEDHQRNEGKPVSHQFAKELLAGFAGAEVDKLAETKGEDWFDKEKTKRHAKQNAERLYDEHYVQNQGADQYDPNQYDRPQHLQNQNCTQLYRGTQTILTVIRELERDCVPEWRIKYLDYKVQLPRSLLLSDANVLSLQLGKKKLKDVARAVKAVNQTPRNRQRGNTITPDPFETAPTYSFLNRSRSGREHAGREGALDRRNASIRNDSSSFKPKGNGKSPSQGRYILRDPEEQPLREGEEPGYPGMTRYGSIIGSPTDPGMDHKRHHSKDQKPPELELPDPALDPDHASLKQPYRAPTTTAKTPPFQLPPSASNAFEVGKTKSPHRQASTLPHRYMSIFTPKRINSMPGTEGVRPRVTRMFSLSGNKTPVSAGAPDMPLESYRELDFRQAEFFNFLDLQLEKIESFYKEKEDEATDRLNVLREQLHIMRDLRLEEIVAHQTAKLNKKKTLSEGQGLLYNAPGSSSDEDTKSRIMRASWMKPLDSALEAAKSGRFGKGTKAMKELGTPSAIQHREPVDDRRDYSRRPVLSEVPYRSAKRKLKTALQEYYRGLELLKSYSLLNRTAFRKITKKYDKAVNARPPGRYMTEKVNKAWFVQSEVLDGHIHVVEDLYARYFEQGNHKVAVGKLRIKTARAGDFTENSFRNGVMVAAGLVFGIEGLIYGLELLNSPDRTLALDTSYLLQIYAGYFLMVFLMLLFCVVCRIWQDSKINFAFVFEFDTRHHLDWRQLSEWRLALAGLYPVEFRDFYLGDMFCSLTYSMGNIELFFCLYANRWNDPGRCNSTHSRLLGFFSTLPGVWRALQCIRRYNDTRNVFPHLVNGGKYIATILFYATLSVYRIGKTPQHRAAFIVFATINAIYCSIWDVVMDWSLGNPYAKNRFLRDTLGYKKVWMYYVAMVVDPIIRFNWIFYAIYPIELQHSAVLSFVVAFSEVFRRGMWSLFRVENEHCTNVGRFRASRDIPLPYELPSITSSPDIATRPTSHHPSAAGQQDGPSPSVSALTRVATEARTSGIDLEAARTRSNTGHRRRRGTVSSSAGRPSPQPLGFSRVGTILHAAHAQDFERKRRPETGPKVSADEDDSDDDEIEVGDESSDYAHDEAEIRKAKAVGESSIEADEAIDVIDDLRAEGDALRMPEEAEHASPKASPHQ
ncbi:EXS-domain-containing protein [Mytilinidion resinicola]|uniref:EXS-domain-containing protein n=1 Tax=Mytilinidion resinicola TaxID=574789 RepID=A0A6A6Z7J4_9PEZI|nr:EXS-domain-containing protein [Mytilinidion resinicola]KAF2816274.1 EXS-domain-containing protein [Mytilinidion resinicola]